MRPGEVSPREQRVRNPDHVDRGLNVASANVEDDEHRARRYRRVDVLVAIVEISLQSDEGAAGSDGTTVAHDAAGDSRLVPSKA
jgi:hypothetical protein